MRKLLKFFLVLLLVIVVNNLIFYAVKPTSYCWANEVANSKNEYLLKHGGAFNTIFIGTSKTLNQADVTTFDSLTNYRTHSFNFGVEGVGAAEIFYFTDNLLKLNKNIKYAFIEIYDIDLVRTENINTSRIKYDYDFNVWAFTINSIWHSNFGFVTKVESIANSSLAMVGWLLKFDLLKDVIGYNNNDNGHQRDLGINQTGFAPCHGEELKFSDIPESRRNYLLDSTSDQRMATATGKILNNYKPLKFNKPYFLKLQALIKRLESNNVKVFLVLAPRINDAQLSNIVPVFMKIDGCTKINLADPKVNPEFYEMKYSFDARHLNLTGAELYTWKLAKEFNNSL